ncbi:hypothetical protein NQZ68_014779 [Dissostichus eleginoides]|nr:hypothetical protein NQZ68_014779 [Dissostichus eleginoides]
MALESEGGFCGVVVGSIIACSLHTSPHACMHYDRLGLGPQMSRCLFVPLHPSRALELRQVLSLNLPEELTPSSSSSSSSNPLFLLASHPISY